jgi:hypothetical protein
MMDELDELRMNVAKAKGWRYFILAATPENESRPKNREIERIFRPGEDVAYFAPYWEVKTELPLENIPPDYFGLKIPSWTTDISAAWELVEEMKSQNVGVLISNSVTILPTPDIWTWEVALYDPIAGPHAEKYFAECPTIAEAICRAYLAWKQAQS